MKKKGFCIWITGLSGSGKTTLAKAFIDALGRPVTFLDGDEVRQTLCSDLGFSQADRDANVGRIAFVANEVVKQGGIVVVACISPYATARQAARDLIGNFFEVHLDIPECVRMARKGYSGGYEADKADVVYTSSPTAATGLINLLVERGFLGTAMMLGRFQPWHEGHTALFREALKEGRVCIGVRRAPGDVLDFVQVQTNIDRALREYKGRYDVIQMPNITNVIYGRSVGYSITRVEFPAETEAVSATKIRAATA